MKKEYVTKTTKRVFEASVDVPGRSEPIVIRTIAERKTHAKQLMMNQLRAQAADRAKEGEKPRPLHLDENRIREI